MNLDQAARYLSRNETEVRKMAKAGIIPAVKVKGEWQFDKYELDDWMEQNPKQSYKIPFTNERVAELTGDTPYKEMADKLSVTTSAISYRMRMLGIRRRG